MRVIQSVMLSVVACVAMNGCATFRRAKPPSLADVSDKLGCPSTPAASVATSLPRPGTPACAVVNRYGPPTSMHTQSAAGMELLSTTHKVNGRSLALTYVHYDDTPENRALRRPIGAWLVQSATMR